MEKEMMGSEYQSRRDSIMICKRHGRPSKRPENKLLLQLYTKKTAPEIAEIFAVSEGTVRSWIRKARQEESFQEERSD